jgi:hypothetical protein
VRVFRATTFEVPDGSTVTWQYQTGVADPAGRSACVRTVVPEDSPLQELGDAIVRRWLWLAPDEPPNTSDPGEGGESIQIGKTVYHADDGGWSDWSDLPLYTPRLVLWPLEATLGISVVRRTETRDVRGNQCVCYLGEARPGDVACESETQLIDPPEPDDEWRAVFAEICVDTDGLVRRIAWSPKFGKRRRGGVLSLVSGIAGSSFDGSSGEPSSRAWEVTELWDYGCEVQIAAPSELVTPDSGSLRELARDLWKKRREHKQESRA